MPLLVSTKGYGILMDTYSPMVFQDTAYGSYLYTEADWEMDFYFMNERVPSGIRAASLTTSLTPSGVAAFSILLPWADRRYTGNSSSTLLFGLGQHEEGFGSLRGETVYLHQANRKIAVPLLLGLVALLGLQIAEGPLRQQGRLPRQHPILGDDAVHCAGRGGRCTGTRCGEDMGTAAWTPGGATTASPSRRNGTTRSPRCPRSSRACRWRRNASRLRSGGAGCPRWRRCPRTRARCRTAAALWSRCGSG